MKIYALHGFLGSPNSWRNLRWPPNTRCCAVDVCADSFGDIKSGMCSWAKAFLARVSRDEDNILLGYSMGGRLALYCLKEKRELWRGAVFLSVNPGLSNDSAKRERLAADEAWAQMVEDRGVDHFLREWNRQQIFVGSKGPSGPFSQNRLIDLLRYWSLAKQPDFRSLLASLNLPILWITGEKDEKFRRIAENLFFRHKMSEKIVLPRASHRLIEDNPLELSRCLTAFLASIR